jgi:hypothetical protein
LQPGFVNRKFRRDRSPAGDRGRFHRIAFGAVIQKLLEVGSGDVRIQRRLTGKFLKEHELRRIFRVAM